MHESCFNIAFLKLPKASAAIECSHKRELVQRFKKRGIPKTEFMFGELSINGSTDSPRNVQYTSTTGWRFSYTLVMRLTACKLSIRQVTAKKISKND